MASAELASGPALSDVILPAPSEAVPLDPFSVPGLIVQIRQTHDQYRAVGTAESLSQGERNVRKAALVRKKADLIFLLLGERQNPDYHMTVTLYRQSMDEVHERSAHRFDIDVSDRSGDGIGNVGASISSLARIPYFQNDARKVLFELVRPDAVKPEPPLTFSTRIHDEIRTVEKDFSAAKRDRDKTLTDELSKLRDRLIETTLRLMAKNPAIRDCIRVILSRGRYEPMIGLQFARVGDSDQSDNYATVPWSSELQGMIEDYDWVDPYYLPEDEDSESPGPLTSGVSEIELPRPDAA